MRIFLTGDTHIPIDVEKLNTKSFPEQKKLTKEDVVIVLGDFGLLWHEDKEYYWWKQWFENKNFTTLWIDGNHENHDWIDSLPVSQYHGGNVHYISDNIIHLMRGQIFKLNNKTFFTYGGAFSGDKAFRKEGLTWWAREEGNYCEEQEALENLEVYHNKVDYILTHTCPDELLVPCFGFTEFLHSTTGKFLNHIAHTIEFKEWYFGHVHVSKDFGKFHALYNTITEIV